MEELSRLKMLAANYFAYYQLKWTVQEEIPLEGYDYGSEAVYRNNLVVLMKLFSKPH